jgi:Glycosyl hydrolase family 79 C-terminal beta domain
MTRALARREFVAGLSASVLTLPASAQADLARVTVDYANDGRPIAPDFIGLSYESAILDPGTYFAPQNAALIALLRALGGAGVLRIGGNTSERTVWEPAGAAAADSIVITPAAIDRLAAILHVLGWKLIYGLNLARGTPQAAAEEAAYVARALGPLLLAFQIGNEPDGFGRWTRVRPATYDVAEYLDEWMRFAAAIRAHVPDARFAGPDVAAAGDWVPPFAAAAPAGLVLLTRHHYAEGPAGDPRVSLPRLLQASGDVEPMLRRLAEAGHAARLPYRIVETNSVFNEGEPGVSDTLGAALWGLDLMFRCAAAGCAGVNFHAGDHNRQPGRNKAYTAIARAPDGRLRAAPLYYGMLMFAQMGHGSLVPARIAAAPAGLSAYAVRAADGSLRVCLINKESHTAIRVSIAPGRQVAGASVLRLAAPAVDATAGITLGAAAVDDVGQWNRARREALAVADGPLVVEVPAASAALLELPV